MADAGNGKPIGKYNDDNHFYNPYGNMLYNRGDGPHQSFRPLFRTPFSKIGDNWNSKAGTRCAKFEKVLLKCAYQGSRDQMRRECWRELEDLEECLYHSKQRLRFQAIQNERRKQKKFIPVPEGDVYHERQAQPKGIDSYDY